MLLKMAVPKSSLKQIGMSTCSKTHMLENDHLEYTANQKKNSRNMLGSVQLYKGLL